MNRRGKALVALALAASVAASVALVVRARARSVRVAAPAPPARTATALATASGVVPLVSMAGDLAIVRVGGSASCVLMPDRTVSCWGRGQRAPAKVEGLSDVFELSVGPTHACALSSPLADRTRGDVYCWGGNDSGQLGDGTTTSRAVAKRIAFAGPDHAAFSAISAATTHTCAQTAPTDAGASALYCWAATPTASSATAPPRRASSRSGSSSQTERRSRGPPSETT